MNSAQGGPDPKPNMESGASGLGQPTSVNHPIENPNQAPPKSGNTTPVETKKPENSSYFEAPKLFYPKDRTAQRSIAPVRTAIYEQPASYRQVSTVRTKTTAEQAQQDAIGWSNVSK
jgi:hypothetical protein